MAPPLVMIVLTVPLKVGFMVKNTENNIKDIAAIKDVLAETGPGVRLSSNSILLSPCEVGRDYAELVRVCDTTGNQRSTGGGYCQHPWKGSSPALISVGN